MASTSKICAVTNKSDDNPWYGVEPDIPKSVIVETINTDVLICGAGTGGMVAAIVSAKTGAKTLIIEKNATVGYFKTYIGVINTRAQKAVADKTWIDKEEIVQELLQYPKQYGVESKFINNTNPVNEKLIRLWADESGPALDFLADELASYGIKHVAEYDVGEGHHGKFRSYPIHTKFLVPLIKGGPRGRVHGGVGVLEPWLVKKAKSYGAQFRFSTPMVKLIKEGDKVVGVIAKNKSGKYIRINASKGVLLTTGGYAADHKLFASLNPQATAVTTYYYGQKGTTGDGHKAAIWAGAEKEKFPTAMLFDRGATKPGGKSGLPFKTPSATLLGPMDAFHFGSQPFLKVNKEGKRFYNEAVPYDAILYPLQFETDGVMCIIWDSNYWKHIKEFHTIGCSRQIPSSSRPKTLEGIGWFSNFALMLYAKIRGYVKKANTIEKLAKKLKLPPEELKNTVDKYNQMAKAGKDTDFGKPAKYLLPLLKPPFYGATNAGWLLTSMDGLNINGDMQVLDKSGKAIKGLYAAGDVAGGFFGNNYYPELVVGCASGKTMTFARHAILHMTGGI